MDFFEKPKPPQRQDAFPEIYIEREKQRKAISKIIEFIKQHTKN
jgi:hypothetical protein